MSDTSLAPGGDRHADAAADPGPRPGPGWVALAIQCQPDERRRSARVIAWPGCVVNQWSSDRELDLRQVVNLRGGKS
jgi:hypothetical protein